MVSRKTSPLAWPKGGDRLGRLLDQALDARIGGLSVLLKRFDDLGLQASVATWRADPGAPPLQPETVLRLFRPEELTEIAAALCLAEDGLTTMLTAYLPARIHGDGASS